MAEFNTTKVEVLFCLCLAKARVKRARNEYKRLSHKINEHRLPMAPDITQKYLDESIDKRLQKSLEDSLPKVGINPAYIEALSNYLGYESYQHFEETFDKYKALAGAKLSRLHFHHTAREKEAVEKAITTLHYPDQVLAYEITHSIIPAQWRSMKNEEETLNIFWVNPEWLEEQSVLPEEVSLEASFLFIVLQNAELTPLKLQELALCLQLVACKLISESPETKPQATKNRPIIIKDSGAINLGNIGSINAKYISSRDMTFHIKKKK